MTCPFLLLEHFPVEIIPEHDYAGQLTLFAVMFVKLYCLYAVWFDMRVQSGQVSTERTVLNFEAKFGYSSLAQRRLSIQLAESEAVNDVCDPMDEHQELKVKRYKQRQNVSLCLRHTPTKIGR